MPIGSLVNNMSYNIGEGNAYHVRKKDDSTITVFYDNPYMKDEECTYTFNKDGSASCVSHAWGYTTEIAKGTINKDLSSMNGRELANLYRASNPKPKKLYINA